MKVCRSLIQTNTQTKADRITLPSHRQHDLKQTKYIKNTEYIREQRRIQNLNSDSRLSLLLCLYPLHEHDIHRTLYLDVHLTLCPLQPTVCPVLSLWWFCEDCSVTKQTADLRCAFVFVFHIPFPVYFLCFLNSFVCLFFLLCFVCVFCLTVCLSFCLLLTHFVTFLFSFVVFGICSVYLFLCSLSSFLFFTLNPK